MAIDTSLYEDEEKEYDYNKILENCNFDFSSEIMTRGNKYYVDGNVLQCFKVNDGFIAKVKGTADKIYTVHINIDPLDEYVEYDCDCPYEDNCKHEYATLIAINYGDYEIANLKPEITEKSESILNIIKSVPAEEIKEYLLTSNDKDLTDKYVIGGNNKEKNVSLIFIVNKDIDSKLTDYINDKNIKVNYFIDGKYLEENMITVKFLSENSNIYYLGENEEYSDENMLYHNNLISMNGSNEPKYCFTSDKDNNTLKLCNDYDMVTIKSDIIKDNIYKRIKDKLNNGVIFAIDSDNIDEIKVSINYILSKGYNIISLEDLLSEKNECK